MGGKLDAWKEILTGLLYPASVTLTTGTEGLLIDTKGLSGIGKATLSVSETASQATSKILDITVHEVASDADAADSANEIATFSLITAANGAQLNHQESIAINFDTMTERYLQILITNTDTFAGVLCVMVELPNPTDTPVTPLSGTVS